MTNNIRELTDQITKDFLSKISDENMVSDIPKCELHSMFPVAPSHNLDNVESLSERIDELLADLHIEAINLSSIQIEYYKPLSAFHKVFRHIILFVKRFIRKCLKFLIEPIVMDIEEYRGIMERTTNDLVEIIEIQNSLILELKEKLPRGNENKDENNSIN